MSTILNPQALSEIKELMGPAFPALATRYVEMSQDYLSTIEQGIASGDVKSVVDAAHPFKSSSRQLAADKVADLAAIIEHEGKEYGNITDEMKRSAMALRPAVEEASAALKAEC